MSDSWDEMRRAKENSYFDAKNREALERLKNKQKEEKPRLSPVTGEPMEQLALHGVVIDRCKKSGGIWLDAGELEQLVEGMKSEELSEEAHNSWLSSFFTGLSGGEKK
jgi:hypothetical protein